MLGTSIAEAWTGGATGSSRLASLLSFGLKACIKATACTSCALNATRSSPAGFSASGGLGAGWQHWSYLGARPSVVTGG